MVEQVRSWLDDAEISVRQLHQRLTPDHFTSGAVPELRRLRDLLSGEALTWDLVEAVADVCFPNEPVDRSGQRLQVARELWERARASPTPIAQGMQELALARDLLAAKDRTIEVYQELQVVRGAFEASERSRAQALQIATLLFAMLGQAQAKTVELKRRVDALQVLPPKDSETHTALELRLSRAQRQQIDLRQQLARAEQERDTAQQVADHAARRMHILEAELSELREWAGYDDRDLAQETAVQVAQPGLQAVSDDDAALDDVDLALQKARAVLDEEHDAVQQAAHDMGYRASPSLVPASVTLKGVPAQAQHVVPEQSLSQAHPESSALSGTTRDNQMTSHDAAFAVDSSRLSADRLRYIGAATRRIARGIDLDEIVMGLCRATVPTFSDAILVYLRYPLPVGDERPTGPLVLRMSRTDRIPQQERDLEDGILPAPENLSELDGLGTELCEVLPGSALAEVLRGVRPVFTDAPEAWAALTELLGKGFEHCVVPGKHAILAPLRGRRRVIGAALFLRNPDRRPFDDDDLLVAAQLATHSALGIDKTVLDGRQALIAGELQRRMLPRALPRCTGVRLASRYLPAADTARVGGDWYDAIPLPGSRIALVVGDVMGHDMASAALMGQLRTTTQTLAGLDLPPQEVLHALDEQAQRLGPDYIATCLYAVYDPVSHRITIANAGHPPPMLLHLGGRAEVLRVPPGAPIGVGGVDFEAVELDAPAGATLLLYTDGLVESRLRDVWTGIEQLREKLAVTAQLTGPDHPPPLEALCDEVLDMLGPGDRDDDIALLAARFDGIAPSDVAYWFLEPEDAAPRRARRLARQALSRWDMENLTDSVELLVSELVTNAVRYATRPITMRLLRTDVLRCEVGDDVPQAPRLRRARALEETGRGLYVVNRLSRRWGVTRLSTGKVVWFELNR
ncbi:MULTISPECIES: ATP-binding SpoIIE family protein phosphatase [Streptomyces]|nr:MULTISPECIES: ATP-binding SpoIIE family protein phosphatase [Streptomyces]MDI5904192.1 SpoIIE family protein phosphatase [Streptomyces sp. 12257]